LKSLLHYFGVGVSVLLVGLFLFEFTALVRYLHGQYVVLSNVKDGTTINYTLRRVNYDALSYFDASYRSNSNTSFLNYKILDNYNAIIEPGQEMELYFYDQSEVTSNNYEFTVCNTKDSTDCQSGSIINIADTNTQVTKSILLSCTPYDTYTLTVTQKSIESGNIIGTTIVRRRRFR
jgi:hypothetical protein